jgi:hypothetical protein
MDFHALALSLGGRASINQSNHYHIADCPIAEILARAGTGGGSVQRAGEYALLQLRVTGGTAVILGALDASGAIEMLRDSDMLLVRDERQVERPPRPIATPLPRPAPPPQNERERVP